MHWLLRRRMRRIVVNACRAGAGLPGGLPQEPTACSAALRVALGHMALLVSAGAG
ncbi:hypothetical protein SODG_000890 [Sodalis praecaptivus]